MFPAAAFVALLAVEVLSVRALGATPGQWLMRLRLRTSADGDVSMLRGLARTTIQNGWLLPLGLFLASAYGGSRLADAWGIAAVAWGGLFLVGSVPAFFRSGRTLHDRVTGTRVLVDTR
jgi:hypothetical protein